MANKTIAPGGGNWSANATWVEGSPPLVSENVVATASSGQLTIDINTAVCASMDFTNYVNTLSWSTSARNVTVSGNVKLVGKLTMAATSTLTSAGKTLPGQLTFTGAITYTLADACNVTGAVIFGGASGTAMVLNGSTLTCYSDFTHTAPSSGTTAITLAGPGTWSGGGTLSNNLTIANSGTLTITNVRYGGSGTLTYTSGTVSATGTLTLTGTPTLNVGSITWTNISGLNGAQPSVVLTSGLTCTGTFKLGTGSSGSASFTGAFNLSCGTFDLPGGTDLTFPAGQTITVTSTIIMAGASSGANIPLLKSGTASSSMFLNFTGTINNNKVFMASYTDVDASGSTQAIQDYFLGNPGGTLTRTTNIIGVNLPVTLSSTGVF